MDIRRGSIVLFTPDTVDRFGLVTKVLRDCFEVLWMDGVPITYRTGTKYVEVIRL